jgi:hypothetical protein
LQITTTKKDKLKQSKDHLRDVIKQYFKKEHPNYIPQFYIQGSYKMGTCIRTKDDTCDLDDGVYFNDNSDDVTCTTLQKWVRDAVDGITDSTPSHNKMCITVDYKAGYNIDIPVYLFKEDEQHPSIAIKNSDWRKDDPKEMVNSFRDAKKDKPQLVRIVMYLKAWCDYKREKMPSGLAMTILAMDNYVSNERDDVSLKFTLIAIKRALGVFKCTVPATPYDDIFESYDETRKKNFLDNLDGFITDANKAVDDEKNKRAASLLWRKQLGDKFPIGEDWDEESARAEAVFPIIGSSKPYAIG